jgi:hypothetical protein
MYHLLEAKLESQPVMQLHNLKIWIIQPGANMLFLQTCAPYSKYYQQFMKP